MRRTLALALVLLLALRLLPGCGSGGEEKGEYELYFAVSSGVGHGPALDTQPLDWPEDVDGPPRKTCFWLCCPVPHRRDCAPHSPEE